MIECPNCHERGGLDCISGKGYYCWHCDMWIGEIDIDEEVQCGET